jgi:hypothetical protein
VGSYVCVRYRVREILSAVMCACEVQGRRNVVYSDVYVCEVQSGGYIVYRDVFQVQGEGNIVYSNVCMRYRSREMLCTVICV